MIGFLKQIFGNRKRMAIVIPSILVIMILIIFLFAGGGIGAPDNVPAANDDNLHPGDSDVNDKFTKPDDDIWDNDPVSEADNEIIIDESENEEETILSGGLYTKKLVEEESINILILGEDEKYTLMDTIGIISIDKKSKTMKLIMIPRDTYLDYNSRIRNFIDKKGLAKSYKINYSYWIGYELKYEGKFKKYHSISFVADVINEKFGIEVDDFIKVNPDGFVEIVDLFGGVNINVPYDMNYEDPYQDLYIHLEKGQQHLDGEQSEGFVRYRKGTDRHGNYHDHGDVARKKNQITFIKEFFKQHATLSNIDKTKELVDTLSSNIWSSIKVWDVLVKYVGVAKDIIQDKYKIESTVLSGELKMIRGVSYMIIQD